ncbi:RDS/peripherin-like protein xRDS35 [Clarias magur]|uniref:RDS/peripherin-like protein xRDS35 n=1 Tax=Clarias magur TaxID=1594786 RepID=A0A8J4UEQ6_CLAMG|nr:RDS/peripherin-like protein xRDS35 [Clarias magur]
MALLKIKFPFQKRVRLAQGLWLLSWVAMVSGTTTFALGVFLKTELFRRAEVMHNNDIHIVPNLLIVVGLTSVGINICAGKVCQDSLDASRFPRWKNFLTHFFCISLFFTSLLLVAMILSYALQPSLEESLKVGLKNGIRFYKDTDTPGRCFQKETIDHLQIEFQCCGNTNYRDWFEVQWVNNRYLDFTSKEVKDRVKSNVDGRFLVDGVPFSCCNPASPRPCIQYHLLDNTAHYNYEYQSEELNLYSRGCRQALVNYYMGLMNTIGPAVLSVFLIQMTVLIGLRYLQTSMEAVEGQENVEIETEGYILEKGVKETAKELKEKVTKLFQQAQVHLFEDMVDDEGQDYMEVNSNSHNALGQYLRLTNGIYLNEVMRIIDSNPKVEQIYHNVGDDKILRVQNFSILNRHLRSYYQCETKQTFIQQIQSLNIETQAELALCIQEVTQDPSAVLPLQYGEMCGLDGLELQTVLCSLARQIQSLLSQRDTHLERIAELSVQNESVSSPTAPPTGPWHNAPEGLSIQLADSKAKLRRLKQEL